MEMTGQTFCPSQSSRTELKKFSTWVRFGARHILILRYSRMQMREHDVTEVRFCSRSKQFRQELCVCVRISNASHCVLWILLIAD